MDDPPVEPPPFTIPSHVLASQLYFTGIIWLLSGQLYEPSLFSFQFIFEHVELQLFGKHPPVYGISGLTTKVLVPGEQFGEFFDNRLHWFGLQKGIGIMLVIGGIVLLNYSK